MYWWLLLLLIPVLILFLPAGLVAGYRHDQWDFFVKVGPVKFRLYPTREKKEKKAAKSGKSKQKSKSADRQLGDFLPIIKTLLSFLSDFRKSVKINDLFIRIVLGGGDPCDLSVQYGYTCAAISNLLPYVNRFLYVKKQKIDVSCDYLADKSTIIGSLDLSLPVGLLLKLVVQYGLRILNQHRSINNQRKGGSAYEPESSSNA